jgi:hypothetical protein
MRTRYQNERSLSVENCKTPPLSCQDQNAHVKYFEFPKSGGYTFACGESAIPSSGKTSGRSRLAPPASRWQR